MNKQRVNCDFPVFTLQGWLLHWLCFHPVRTACVFLSSHQHCSPWLLLPREYNRVYDFVLFLCVLGHTYMLLQCKSRQIYVLIAQNCTCTSVSMYVPLLLQSEHTVHSKSIQDNRLCRRMLRFGINSITNCNNSDLEEYWQSTVCLHYTASFMYWMICHL